MPTQLPIPDDVALVIERIWSHLGAPGNHWTGPERVRFLRVARKARDGGSPSADSTTLGAAERAAATVATEAHTIDATFVSQLAGAGVSRLAYGELLGVVSFGVAIDAYTYGIGAPQRPLPEPADGEVTRHIEESATIDGGWIPTVGPAFAHNALSAIPGEHEAKHDLTGTLYLREGEIFDLDYTRDGLTRTQIELLAARTSLLNDCFF